MHIIEKDNSLLRCFKLRRTDDQIFYVKFSGEGSDDYGGPFRDMITNLANELQSHALPLLVKTANNRNSHGENRDCWTINGSSTSPTHIQLFKTLGYFLGFSARTKAPLDLNLAPSFWKKLLGVPLVEDDLKDFDTYTWQVLQETRSNASNFPAEDFDAVVEEKFITFLSNQEQVELCPDGENRVVTHANHSEYIDLVVKARLEEGNKQMEWIKEGMNKIIPLSILSFLDWRDIELRVCGSR